MNKYDIAAYVWPAYHYEPRLEHFWPEKDGEWYTVRRGKPKFTGHDMPRIPLLGYQDEANPQVMRQHVALAKQHGINVFIVDWYWYDNAPCFERQLNNGLIPALKETDMKFYLMWANHDADSLWDMHTDERRPLWSGQVDRTTLECMFDRIIDKYFTLDSYYCIDGKPVFSIFYYPNFIAGLGGVEQAVEALEWMRDRCVEKGFQGLHVQATVSTGGHGPEAGVKLREGTEYQAAKALSFDSVTSYQYSVDAGREGDYVSWASKAIACWPYFEMAYKAYYPHVSIGWDNTQRNPSIQTSVTGSTPDAFEACLWKAKEFLDTHPNQTQLVTINSWNEWTEGSYLLPDMRWGYRYLKAVRNVFGSND